LGDGAIAFDSYCEAGRAYLESGKPARTIEALTRALKIDPDADSAHWMRAEAYAGVGKFQEAIDDTEKCERSLDMVRADLERSVRNHDQIFYVRPSGQSKKTTTDPRVMIAGNYEFRADCFNHLKQYAKAAAEFSKAIQVNPHNDE